MVTVFSVFDYDYEHYYSYRNILRIVPSTAANRSTLVARVARVYFSAPSTSVPSERLFSSAGLAYTDRRNRLDGDRAEQLLVVKHNLQLLDFDY